MLVVRTLDGQGRALDAIGLLKHMVPCQHEPGCILGGVIRNDTVVVCAIALRGNQTFVTALGVPNVIHPLGRASIPVLDDRKHGVVQTFHGIAAVIGQSLGVSAETAVHRVFGDMTRVRTKGDIAPRQRRSRGIGTRCSGRVSKPVYNVAIKATAAHLDRLAVPFNWQVQLETDRRSVRTRGVDPPSQTACLSGFDFGATRGQCDLLGRNLETDKIVTGRCGICLPGHRKKRDYEKRSDVGDHSKVLHKNRISQVELHLDDNFSRGATRGDELKPFGGPL